MPYEQKPGQGSLFVNNRKRDGRNDPHLTGTITLPDGTRCYLDAWTRKDKNGNPWLSLSVKLMDRQPEQAPPPAHQPAPLLVRPPQPKQPGGFEQMDDDLPF